MPDQAKDNLNEGSTIALYKYETITFELLKFLENQRDLTRISRRIACESTIQYTNKKSQNEFLFQIGWNQTNAEIDRKKIILWKSNRIDNFKCVPLSEVSFNWVENG